MKKIKNLKGITILSNIQQKNVLGGKAYCSTHYECGSGNCCNTAGWCQVFGSQGDTGFLCDGELI